MTDDVLPYGNPGVDGYIISTLLSVGVPAVKFTKSSEGDTCFVCVVTETEAFVTGPGLGGVSSLLKSLRELYYSSCCC